MDQRDRMIILHIITEMLLLFSLMCNILLKLLVGGLCRCFMYNIKSRITCQYPPEKYTKIGAVFAKSVPKISSFVASVPFTEFLLCIPSSISFPFLSLYGTLSFAGMSTRLQLLCVVITRICSSITLS